MKLFALLLAVVLLLAATTLIAQQQPVKSLSVGNSFHYLNMGDINLKRGDTIPRPFERVLRDTVIQGRRYAVVYSSFDRSLRFERSDSIAVYGWRNGRDVQLYSWFPKIGDTIRVQIGNIVCSDCIVGETDRGPDMITKDTGVSISLNNYPLTYKGQSTRLSFGIFRNYGITSMTVYGKERNNPLFPILSYHLRGAVIDGAINRPFTDTTTFTVILNVPTTPQAGAARQAAVAAPTPAPNPFADGLRLNYNLATPAFTEVVVYSLQGLRLAVPQRGQQAAGSQSVEWNGKTSDGIDVPSGTYLISLFVNGVKAGDVQVVKSR